MLEWTGERFLPYVDPSITGAEIHYEHLHRYAFASQFVKGKKVLDLASGEGYGTFILSQDAQSVVGIEIDPVAVSHAVNIYNKENIAFKEGSILNIPIEGEKLFEVIVCFEAIEHVKEHDILLKEIRRLLKDDGLLIISTPDKKHYSDETGYQNPFHRKELYQTEFSKLLKKYFSYVYLSGQQVISGSSIYPVSPEKSSSSSEFIIEYLDKHFSFVKRERRNPKYFIAIASNIKLNPKEIQKSYLIDKSNTEISLFNNQLIQCNAAISSLNQTAVANDQQISMMKEQISLLDHQIVQRDAHIIEITNRAHILDTSVADRDNQIAELKLKIHTIEAGVSDKDNQIAELKLKIHTIEAGVSDRDNQIAELKLKIHTIEAGVSDKQITELKLKIHNLQASVTERENQIIEVTSYARHLEQEISAKNQHIIDLTNQYYTLKQENNSMVQSIAYQSTRKFHCVIIERLFPQNSRRRTFYDRGLKLGRILINDGWKEGLRVIKKYQADKKIPKNDIGRKEKTESTGIEEKKKFILNIPETELNNGLHVFLSKTKSRLVFPYYKKPVVSIIILTYNKSSYTYQCLQSILKYSNIPYELILVDNGSTDNTTDLLNRIDHGILIKNKTNLGFIKGCNKGAKKARGKYLLFLNNDTVVTENWLPCLVKTIETYPKCGAVGSKLVWPNGKLQEGGSIIWKDGSALGYGRGDDPLKPEYSYIRDIDFCSGACLLVRTDLFQLLKGFDERYIPAYYEDADLCLGIKNLGYRVLFQPKVTIFHHEFTSSSQEHAIKYMITNQSKFVEKWQELLKTKEVNSPNMILNARDNRNRKRILVIDDRIPASNQGSGYPRANIFLRYLGELGYKVTFFPITNTTPWQPYTTQFQDLGIEVLYGDNLNFEEFSQKRANFYDVVVVSRPHNFERTFQIIKSYFPNAYLIYDAEALFSTREILKAKIDGKTLDDNQIRNLREKEFELMRKADLIITVSENEKKIIQETGGLDNIIIFGHPVQVQDTIAGFNTRKDILFVGSFLALNGPNDDAIIYFVKNIWPEVQKQLKCKLYIVGINPPDKVLRLASESIIVTGFVPNLENYYNNCRIFIVPHRYAAGIPLKLIEAMSYGIPSVVSELIGSQLNLVDGKEVFIASDSEDFAREITMLYQNKEKWEEIRQKSLDFVKESCNYKEFFKIFPEILDRR